MKWTFVGVLILLLVPFAGGVGAQSDAAESGTIAFVITGSDGEVITQDDDAAWKIEPASQRDASARQFVLRIYSVAGDSLADNLTFRDVPVELETRAYSVASTRGPADLYGDARVQGYPVNPRGTFTVKVVDAKRQTFSGSFSLELHQSGGDGEVAAVVTGVMTDLPIIPLGDCQTSGTNTANQFTFRVDGSGDIASFDLPANEGAWIMETYPTYTEGASPWLRLTLQDRVDNNDGLRLEISRIPLGDPAGTYSGDPYDEENGLVVSLTDRGAFQLNMADEGSISLLVNDEAGTLSGVLTVRILAADGTDVAVITGSFAELPLPTGLCIVQNYVEEDAE